MFTNQLGGRVGRGGHFFLFCAAFLWKLHLATFFYEIAHLGILLGILKTYSVKWKFTIGSWARFPHAKYFEITSILREGPSPRGAPSVPPFYRSFS